MLIRICSYGDYLHFCIWSVWNLKNFVKGGITHSFTQFHVNLEYQWSSTASFISPKSIEFSHIYKRKIQLSDSFGTMQSSWRHGVGGAKEWRALERDHQQNTDIWCRFTYCLYFRIMTGVFYSWGRSSFQYQTMCKSSSNWALFIKRSTTNILVKLHCCPEKQTASTVHVTLGYFGKANLYISLTAKTTLL